MVNSVTRQYQVTVYLITNTKPHTYTTKELFTISSRATKKNEQISEGCVMCVDGYRKTETFFVRCLIFILENFLSEIWDLLTKSDSNLSWRSDI